MNPMDHLIKRVSKYVSFGQPVSSGSVVSQRLSDPRMPMQAFYLIEQLINAIGEEQSHHVILRMTEIVKKSEREDWRPYSKRT
ncbi:hypothetical protein [Paenibacillus tyrfis]|uniref:Uncharacterized protein n=1 Tax=Paenibacillus tyrfis TaxID=1501230 RepID=A0A081NZ83_9BACL|nr:hypothetical protein [Paenibacillus tyrfis]KEQ23756.1 hypothetical protein ET33_14915 [Paenibacillus tyrfis]